MHNIKTQHNFVKWLIQLACVSFLAIVGIVLTATPVFAESLEDSIIEKTALTGLYNCYRNGNMKGSITMTSYGGTIISNDSSSKTSLPFGHGNNLTCSQLLKGTGSSGGSKELYSGLLKSAGVTMPGAVSEPSAINSFLLNMGYNAPDDSRTTGRCAIYTYNSSNPSLLKDQTIKVCLPNVDNDKIVGLNGFSMVTQSTLPDGNKIVYVDTTGDSSIRFCAYSTLVCDQPYIHVGPGGYTTWEAFTRAMLTQLDDVVDRRVKNVNGVDVTFELNPEVGREPYGDSPYTLGNKLGGKSGAADKAIAFLSNGKYSNHTKLALTNDERVFQLQWELNNTYGMEVYGCQLTSDEKAIAENRGYSLVHLYRDSSWQVCYAKPKSASDKETFDKTVSELDKFYGSNVTDPGAVDGSNPGNNPGVSGGDSSSITACYKNAGALGWFVCPVMEVVGKMTEGLYGYIEGNFLQVGTNLSDANGVREGWGIFRDFTNIIFIIMFLVVIISQVTGIGVSNYGIKKILPRLIIIVVMVNISFLLCQLAIDISNILGSGLKNMFIGFATKIDRVPFNLGTVAGGIIGAAFSTAGTVAVLSALSLTIPWATWLFPIFLTLISCLISVFFFMILLGVRQAGVIILMVLSPVAIICYALPNTKMFFDRWRKLFVSLLMVYPVCGILMGGGQFASTLLLSVADDGAGGVFFTIVAMLVSVVPFFFIPSILKASMMAMGNLGMKISQFGRGIGGGITRGIRGSEIGRDIQRRANMRYADRAAAKIERKAARLAKKGKPLSKWNRTRLGRYNATYNRLGYEDIRAGGIESRLKPGTSAYESMVENMRDEQFGKEVVGKQNLIKSGSFDSITSAGNKVNGEDDTALATELDEYLRRIINAKSLGYDDSKVAEYVKSAQAIINTLSDRGTSGARTKVINSFSNALDGNAASLMSATGDERDRLRKTFGSLASRIASKYGKAYKGDYPGASAMLGDIAKGDFRYASTFRSAADLDIDGNVTGSHLRSTQYTGAGLDGMNTEDFSKLKTSGLSSILAGIQDGDITGEKLQEVARLADEVLNSDVYTPDGDARKYMERIADAAFASSSVPVPGGRTAGSAVISRANSRALSSILNQVQGAADWSHLSTDQQQHFGHLMSNIHESLANDSFTASDAGQLKQTLKIGRAKNFEDAATGTIVGEFAGTPTLKITHADGARQKVSLPAGWARDPGGRWIEVTSSGMRPLNAAEIKKAEQIETHNNQVDIDNGTV